MPVQDLTPQLRTRLSRLERWVGIFVALATVLVLVGLAFYVRQVAQRKGWYLRKLPYYTFVNSAAGLKIGQPVKMMGFDVGAITKIEAMPAEDKEYTVFIGFVVTEPYEGYLWDDSRAHVVLDGFLGGRYIEVTKGTNAAPTYIFNPFKDIDLAEARANIDSTTLLISGELFGATSKEIITKPGQSITAETLHRMETNGIRSFQVIDRSAQTEWPTGLWVPQAGRYEPFDRRKSKGCYMPPDEQPALTERLEQVANMLQDALPNVLDLTNHLQRTLKEAANAAAQADQLLAGARPVVTNLAVLTAQLTNGPGALGELLLPTNLQTQLGFTLTNAGATMASANLLVTNIDARIGELATTLNRALEELAGITSNLHHQVDMNTNILGNISKLVVDADEMVLGLKRHWLLRSAFKEKKTNAPPAGATKKSASPKQSR